MNSMFVTELTTHLEMLELKLVASVNMRFMSLTDPTSQFEISELKLDAL